MAQYTAYANYVIYFADPAEYNYAIALCGGNGYGHCPVSAASQFGLTFPPPSGPLGAKGMYGFAPYGIPDIGAGVEVYHPMASGVFLESDVDTVLVPGQIPNPTDAGTGVGPDMLLTWWGYIVKINPQGGGAAPPPTTQIPQRRFIGGLELGGVGEGGSGFNNVGSRDSSRTVDGKGFPIRGNNAIPVWLRTLSDFVPGLTTRQSWERFYVRLRTLGTNSCGVWRSRNSVSPNAGHGIRISTAGKVEGISITAALAENLIGTSTVTLTLNKWYLIDILLTFPSAAPDVGTLKVYINHNLEINATVSDGTGIDSVGFHASSQLGQWTTAENQWEIDLDDWICADIPADLNGIDWNVGSHIRAVDILSGSLTNYTGPVPAMNQGFNPETPLTSALTSSTALAEAEGLTDVIDEQDRPGAKLGPVTIHTATFTNQVASSDGKLGFRIAGGASSLTTIDETNVFSWKGVIYRPSGLYLPSSVVPLSIVKQKSNDANANTLNAVTAVVEDIGAWGTEDYSDVFPASDRELLHNCRYANTEYAFLAGVPTAPAFSIGGTYTGNGTSQSINLPAPAHFIHIRGLTGASTGVKFFAASLGAHRGCAERFPANYLVRVWVDSLGQAKFTVSGTDAEINAAGVTYQYIAFCDPGMRFNVCGVFNRPSALASGLTPLFDPNFTPLLGFVQKDVIASTTNTVELSFKGPGHGVNAGNIVDGTAVASWGNFSAGFLNTLSGLHAALNRAQYNFSLWRTTDPDCGNTAVQIFTYTGNGGGARTLTFPITTGRYPLFAMVMPHDTNPTYFRDPSHTGSNSQNLSTLASDANHITGGGVDSLTVASAMNTNLVVYDVFIILGDSAGWNNGVFYLSNCKAKGPWPLPPYNPTTDPVILADGGLLLNGQPGLLLVKDLSGIYTLIPDKTCDTVYDRQTGQTNVDVEIPDPTFKTGYIGG